MRCFLLPHPSSFLGPSRDEKRKARGEFQSYHTSWIYEQAREQIGRERGAWRSNAKNGKEERQIASGEKEKKLAVRENMGDFVF